MSTPSGRTDNSEAESRCPTPGCDGSGNTKSRHTSHRSVQKCPLMRDRIAEYSAVLSPEQVEDIVSGRAPFPFDAMPGQLSSNRKASSKAAASRGCIGKLTAAAAAALKKEDETRLANARSTRLADSVASSPNRAVHNTRLASRKNNRTGLATTADDDDHKDEEKEADLVPNSPVAGRLISSKKLLLEKKGHSLSATSPVKGPSATTSTTSNHINFISSALAKKRAEMAKSAKVVLKEELGLARRLSEAQNEEERLRPQKALLDDSCGIGAEFLKICKKLAPLNEPPLPAEDDDLIDVYLGRISNIAQQRDQSEENQSAFDLLKDSFKHIWLQLQQADFQ